MDVDALRREEYARLEGVAYCDAGGAVPYAASAVRAAAEALLADGGGGGGGGAPLLGNPHSGGLAARGAADAEGHARAALLARLGVRDAARMAEWEVVWTSGATAALRLAAEALPWRAACGAAAFVHSRSNHTSALGMREYALAEGAEAVCVDIDAAEGAAPREVGAFRRALDRPPTAGAEGKGESLAVFVLPAECNFSGTRYTPEAAAAGKAYAAARVNGCERAFCVVDAARAAGSGAFDLGAWHAADMVAVSLYKMVGYPTALGALLVRRHTAAAVLRTGFFGGGTIDAAAVDADVVVRRGDARASGDAGDGGGAAPTLCAPRLEHGTPPFAEIACVAPVLATLERWGTRGDAHARAVAAHAAASLAAMVHANGAPVCVLHGSPAALAADPAGPHAAAQALFGGERNERQGATVAFSVLSASGEHIGHWDVWRAAEACGIVLRAGCFCNPGACQEAIGAPSSLIVERGRAGLNPCADTGGGLVDGQPTGAVRLSFCHMSTFEDADAAIECIRGVFCEGAGTAADAKAASFPASRRATAPSPRAPAPSALVESDEGADCEETGCNGAAAMGLTISSLFVYPVKSLCGMKVRAWSVDARGLRFDREWALVHDATGRVLSLRDHPRLAAISAAVEVPADETTECCVLVLSHDLRGKREDFRIPFWADPDQAHARPLERAGARGDAVGEQCAQRESLPPPDDLAEWLMDATGVPCSLVRFGFDSTERAGSRTPSAGVAASFREEVIRRKRAAGANGTSAPSARRDALDELALHSPVSMAGTPKPASQRAFTNEAQLLVVSESSVAVLNGLIKAAGGGDGERPMDALDFRPNVVVGARDARGRSVPAWTEETWSAAWLGARVHARVVGECTRCSAVRVDRATRGTLRAARGGALAALARRRRGRGATFGVLMDLDEPAALAVEGGARTLRVGDALLPTPKA